MYESEGIRHIEIHSKTKKKFSGSESEEDDAKEAKHHNEQLLRADSDKISMDSILKAVINISDRLDEQEKKLKLHHESTDTKQTSSGKHKKKRRDRMNPETAVHRYTRGDSSSSDSASVSDLEQSQTSSKLSSMSKLSAKGRRLHLGRYSARSTPTDIFPERRKNMSFSNDSVRKIDSENQRLLKEILHTKSTTLIQRKNNAHARPSSASAINRLRRQKDIENENLRLLNRLQSVKATNSLSRVNLLSDHHKTLEHTNRISKTSKSRPISAPALRPLNPGRHLNTFDNTSTFSGSTSASTGKRSLSASTKKKKVKVYNVFEPGW